MAMEDKMRPTRWRTVILVLLVGTALVLAGCGGAGAPAATKLPPGTVSVDIIALNHPPVWPVIQELQQTLAPYGDKVHVTQYDFDTQQGADFAKKMRLSGHIPIAIFINGKDTFTLNGRSVTFVSFPQGQGTGMVAEGGWTVADVDAVLQQVIGQ